MDKPNEKPLYGGQAVMEGVMMRGKNAYAVAVRDPENRIVVHTQPLNPAIYDSFISRTPFLRGITMLWDALGIGMKALMFSADVAMPEMPDGEEDGELSEALEVTESVPVGSPSETVDRQADEAFKATRLRWYAGQKGDTDSTSEPWLGMPLIFGVKYIAVASRTSPAVDRLGYDVEITAKDSM